LSTGALSVPGKARQGRDKGDLDVAGKPTVHGIEPQQMGVGLDRTEIVDGDNLNVRAPRFGDRAKDIAADAAKSVDCDSNRHVFSFSASGSAGAARSRMACWLF
jgi:hypothetical protein